MKFSLSDETKTADLADDFCRICRGHQPFLLEFKMSCCEKTEEFLCLHHWD